MQEYTDTIKTRQIVKDVNSTKDVIVRVLQQPTCTNASITEKGIEVDGVKCIPTRVKIKTNNKELTKMLVSLGIFTESEITSRYEIMLDSYSKTIQVEALTTLKMAKNQIFPACLNYINNLSITTINLEKNNVESTFVKDELIEVTNLVKDLKIKINNLDKQIEKVQSTKTNAYELALLWKDNVLLAMNELRKVVDKLETLVDSTYWPMPTYTNLLFDI